MSGLTYPESGYRTATYAFVRSRSRLSVHRVFIGEALEKVLADVARYPIYYLILFHPFILPTPSRAVFQDIFFAHRVLHDERDESSTRRFSRFVAAQTLRKSVLEAAISKDSTAPTLAAPAKDGAHRSDKTSLARYRWILAAA
jgi:hypothetical protein